MNITGMNAYPRVMFSQNGPNPQQPPQEDEKKPKNEDPVLLPRHQKPGSN